MKTKTTEITFKEAAENIQTSPQVLESLWRVVDAARCAVSPGRTQSRDDALSFLADQEKMLRRALGAPFKGTDPELLVRTHYGVEKHPYVKALDKEEREYLRSLRPLGKLPR